METVFPHPTLSEMMHEGDALGLWPRHPLLIRPEPAQNLQQRQRGPAAPSFMSKYPARGSGGASPAATPKPASASRSCRHTSSTRRNGIVVEIIGRMVDHPRCRHCRQRYIGAGTFQQHIAEILAAHHRRHLGIDVTGDRARDLGGIGGLVGMVHRHRIAAVILHLGHGAKAAATVTEMRLIPLQAGRGPRGQDCGRCPSTSPPAE